MKPLECCITQRFISCNPWKHEDRLGGQTSPAVTLWVLVSTLAVRRLSSGQPEPWSSAKDDKLLLSRVTAAHMAPYATVHAFLNNTRELRMSLNASSRRITAAELLTQSDELMMLKGLSEEKQAWEEKSHLFLFWLSCCYQLHHTLQPLKYNWC